MSTVQINLEQLRNLAAHAKSAGTQDGFIDLALEFAEKQGEEIARAEAAMTTIFEMARGDHFAYPTDRCDAVKRLVEMHRERLGPEDMEREL